jgi:(2Fe-2S) ferredoxin
LHRLRYLFASSKRHQSPRPSMENEQPALRIFACMKTRTDCRASCGPKGAADIILALRKELEERGFAAAHIDVRPSACLERCEEGPILIGLTGAVAEQATPPRKLDESQLTRPDLFFERVSPDQIPSIVDELLGLKP